MTDSSSKDEKTPLVAVYNEKPDLRKKEPPLVSLQVTNPVTYIKRWWKRVLGGEGVDFHLKIKPFTALALAVVFLSFGYGIGHITVSDKEPYIKYTPPLPTPTPDPWITTAYTGTLHYTSAHFYLLTTTSEAINLEVPGNISLTKLVGKRIFATGKFNLNSKTLVVSTAEDLEILSPTITPVPTTASTPTPTPLPTDSPSTGSSTTTAL